MSGSFGSSPADEITRQREQILELAHRYGAHNVRVFGSVARGEADDASDVDFLVDLEPGPRIRQRVLSEAIPV